MKQLILSVLLLTMACGSKDGPDSQPKVLPPVPVIPQIEVAEPQHYIELFQQQARQHISADYTVVTTWEFVDSLNLDTVKVAQCFPYEQHIQIDKGFWDSHPDGDFRETTLFHELGHCELGRDHINTLRSDGSTVSIMDSGEHYVANEFAKDQQYYIDELFSFKKPQCQYKWEDSKPNFDHCTKREVDKIRAEHVPTALTQQWL